jgi:hypothetical protein
MPRDAERKWLLLIPVGILLALAAPSFLARTSNCGGNSAALFVCKNYALIFELSRSDSAELQFSVTNVAAQYHAQLGQLARYHWVPNARFLVSTASVSRDGQDKPRLIVVCDTPYGNVPQRQFFKAPFTHAVGYADGSTALISPAEFARLDKSLFVPLDTLYPKPIPERPKLEIATPAISLP